MLRWLLALAAQLVRDVGDLIAGAARAQKKLTGPEDGVVYFASAHTIGVRTQDALYRFLRGFGKPVMAAHHLFAGDEAAPDPVRAQHAWESWLSRTLA
jgi:hypothetical protein